MLTLRFDLMDDVFGAHCELPVASAPPLQRHVRLAPCVTPACAGATPSTAPSLSSCYSDLFSPNPAIDDDDDDELDRRERRRIASDLPQLHHQSFAFGDVGEFDEDFDLGPPPPTGPVLMRQRATDWTAAREAKAASLAQKLEAPTSSAAAFRSARLIPPSSSSAALSRRSRFMGV